MLDHIIDQIIYSNQCSYHIIDTYIYSCLNTSLEKHHKGKCQASHELKKEKEIADDIYISRPNLLSVFSLCFYTSLVQSFDSMQKRLRI